MTTKKEFLEKERTHKNSQNERKKGRKNERKKERKNERKKEPTKE